MKKNVNCQILPIFMETSTKRGIDNGDYSINIIIRSFDKAQFDWKVLK